MIPDMLLIESGHISLPQLHPGFFRLPVGPQLLGAAGVRCQLDAALRYFLQPVGTLHTHIILLRFLDLSVCLGGNGGERRSLDRMRQLGRRGGLVHVLKP